MPEPLDPLPRRPARLLRRRRPGDQDRRDGAREMGRAGLRPPRDRPQPLRGRRPARPRARSSSRSSTTARPTARWSSPPTACRNPCPPRPRPGSMLYVDATCPLVSKVHIEAERHHENGLQMVMIGHAGHPETIGTMGQLPPGAVMLVETVADVAAHRAARPRAARLHHPDHALGRRHRRDRRRPARPLPGDRRPAQGGHLLRHHQPPGGGQGDGAARSTRSW